ncbi:MAG: tetratricopeptide repeat protein [Geobacteraceae bacterium]|nr:tetratricopeptide repeat protein [Geobacteraceae bacterium]
MGPDSYESARIKSCEAAECLENGDYEGALASFAAAVELLPEDGHLAKARLCSNIGHILVRLQQYEEAANSFGKALALFLQSGDRVRSAEQIGNIGSVYRDTENWAASLDNYRKALTIFEEVEYKAGIADQSSNIGYVCSRQGAIKDAVQYFGKAKDLYLELGEDRKVGLCEQNLQQLEALTKNRG